VERIDPNRLHDALLDAAEAVVVQRGIANLTLNAVAEEVRMSKGGVLHHFPTKDRLIEAMVRRSAESWRARYTQAYARTPQGPGRMARALLDNCLSDSKGWRREVQRGSSACFAALAQNPDLIAPMREVYFDLQQRLANDGLPSGVGEAIGAAINGLWLYSVLGLVPVSEGLMDRVRHALAHVLEHSTKREYSADHASRGRSRGVDKRLAGGRHQ
jgi:AcrR family transcriptional regulator